MVETAEALLRGQQKTERAVAAAFRAGESDRLAWLSAQYETATAELARVNALSQAQQTLGRLEDALRRPIGPHALAVTADQVISSKPRPYEEQP